MGHRLKIHTDPPLFICLHYRFCVCVSKVDPTTYSRSFPSRMPEFSVAGKKVQVGTLFETELQKSKSLCNSASLKGLTVLLSWTISNAALKTLWKWLCAAVQRCPHTVMMTSEATSGFFQSKYWQTLWQRRAQVNTISPIVPSPVLHVLHFRL